MGMTDRQFDLYLTSHVRNLKNILENCKDFESIKKGLEEIIKEIEAELKRP
jgi:ribosomal protein L7Ae-like RNA K-turn-binding protein